MQGPRSRAVSICWAAALLLGASLAALPAQAQATQPSVAWLFDRSVGTPAMEGGKVFVAGDEAPLGLPGQPRDPGALRLYALDLARGTVLWHQVLLPGPQRAVLSASLGAPPWAGPPTVAGGSVYVQDTQGTVHAINAGNGTLRWRASAGPDALGFSLPPAAPVVAAGRVLAWGGEPGPANHTVYRLRALDPATGALLWSSAHAWPRYGPELANAGIAADASKAYVTSTEQRDAGLGVHLRAVRLTDGSDAWATDLPGHAPSAPIVNAGRIHFATVHAGLTPAAHWHLAAVSPDGALLWDRAINETGAGGLWRPAADGSRLYAVGTRAVVAVEAGTGAPAWNVTLAGDALAPPVLGPRGLLVVRQREVQGGGAIAQEMDPLLGNVRWQGGSSFGQPRAFGEGHAVGTATGWVGPLPFPDRLREAHGGPALVAYGPDLDPPAWAGGPTLEVVDVGGGQQALWRGDIIDLNLDGVRIEQAGSPNGTWTAVGWLPDVPFDRQAGHAWILPPPSAAPRFYRAVPVDMARHEGTPSAIVEHTQPAWLAPPPPAPGVVTLDSPAPDESVSGVVQLRGRTFWRGNGTPLATEVHIYARAGTFPTGEPSSVGLGSVHSDGAWSFAWDSRTFPFEPTSLRPDGPVQLSIEPMSSAEPLRVNLTVANGHFAAVEEARVTRSADHVVEGEPVDVTVNLTVRSGLRPDGVRVTYEWPMPDQGGHQVGAGFAAPAAFQVLGEGPDGVRFRIVAQHSLYTVNWPADATVKVGLRVERGGQGFNAPVEAFPITVQPDANAAERAAAIQEARRPPTSPLPSPAAVAVGAGAVGAVGLAAALGTEVGRYAALRALGGLALFTRISGNQVLEHRRREQLYLLVEGRPGVTFRALGHLAGMRGGVLTHHLTTLEREGLVRRQRVGARLAFYAAAAPTPLLRPVPPLQARLLALVRAGPVSQAEAARRLGVSRQALHYHVHALRTADLLELGREGRETPLRLAPGAADRLAPCPTCRALLLGDRTGATACPACGAPLSGAPSSARARRPG